MNASAQPLIVGAGPVGLAAALFLTRKGLTPRLVELRHEPSKESKALAVNPRTLDILKPTGITQRMLELGKPIRGVYFCRGTRRVAHFELAGAHPDYPFMLGLSQATTERLLTEALQQAGVTVQRGRKLVACRQAGDRVEATIEATDDDGRQVVQCPWLLAADGARSVARQQMGIDFGGSSLPGEWYLADVPLCTRLPDDHGQVFFLPQGEFLFMIPVIDADMQRLAAAPIWRIITNRPDPLSRLIEAEPAGAPLWESDFHIAHRINATLAKGGVYFAGDAAHIHSPIGARGMNLGIEDAWVFAELAAAGRLAEYDAVRRPVDRAVVRRVERLSLITAADSLAERFTREWLLPVALQLRPMRKLMLRVVSGLDHPLPKLTDKSGAALMREVSKGKAVGASAVGAAANGAQAVGSLAVGAVALGAIALGSLAVGRLVIRRLAIRDAHIRRLVIDELTVKRFVSDGDASVRPPPSSPARSA